MPQLVKGGKNVFAWSKVGITGKIKIPEEVISEYQLHAFDKVIVIGGSKTSGGFSIVKIEKMKDSPLAVVLDENPELNSFKISNDKPIKYKNRFFTWTEITQEETLCLSNQALKFFGIKPGDKVLSVRGSGLGVGFIVKGPIIKEAENHQELKVYE